MSNNLSETLNKITQTWFLSEPLLFSVFCSHEFVANEKLHIPFRTGKMRIEYCPQIIEQLSEHEIAEYLKIEMFRILLKHPYQRQPTGANKAYLSIASDITLYANYQTDVKLDGVETIKELLQRYVIMKHGMPVYMNRPSQSNEFTYRNIVSKYWNEREKVLFDNEVKKGLPDFKTRNPDNLKFMVNGIEYRVTRDEFNRLTVFMPNGTEFPQPNSSTSVTRIPAAAIHTYLERNHAERIQNEGDSLSAYIGDEKFLFQLEGEHYIVLKYNSLLGRFEIMQESGIIQFWLQRLLSKWQKDGIIDFPKDLCFEEWYSKILAVMNFMTEEGDEDFQDGNTGGEGSENKQKKEKTKHFDNLSELSELWEEDEQSQQKISNMIDDAEKAEQWGSVSGNIKDLIQANKTVNMNYVEILRHFSASLVSSKRNLTRMKPNRRFGFDRLGSRYSLTSNLLVAVDISSSITNENLEYVFSIINKFFRYGVEQIDVIQFDTQIQGEVVEMKRAAEYIQINGRGGTDFQPAADFYCKHKEYDGLIYFTDGFGPHPEFKERVSPNVLWIFTAKAFYDKGIKWTQKISGNSATYIPLP